MEVEFRTRRLERCYHEPAFARRAWGERVARRYVERTQAIVRSRSFAELRAIPALRVHPLRGDRSGLHSLTLTGRWRLVVEVLDARVIIVEVTNHYGD